MEVPSKEKTKRKQKKQGSLEEALADLDDIPSLGISRKSQKIKVYQQNKDCLTGKYEVKSTKTYPRKKKVVKALKSNSGPAVASSSSTYDLPDYSVEHDSIDDDIMESEREYSPKFLTMLDEIEKDIPFKMEKTAWERRKINLEGNWANARKDLFHALLLRNSIPEKHAVCCKCNLNEAVIKCQECRKFLCSECDGILHNQCPFHNRNVWINGFYEGIKNNETVFDSNIITIERCLPVIWPTKCPVCKSNGTIARNCVQQVITVITLNARKDTLIRHTAFWNGRKIENLPISLGKQYLKTKQRLTLIKKEKDALINSVDDSNIRIGDDMIANWEADFREKAKASLNRNSSTTIVNQLAEYFKLHEELFSVPIVDKFMDNTDKASRQEELYCLLNSTKENYGRKKKRMALLERKLFCDGCYTKEEALRDGKEQLTEQTIDVLRTRLVHIYINLKQQKLEVSKLADSSKKRIKIRKQILKNTSVLESTVDKYNLVSSISSKRYSKLEKADMALGKFAWQTDAAECYVVPVWLRKQIVEKNVILKRCREELSLLVEEMGSFTSFSQERINKHQQEILEIEQGLTGGENSNIIEILSTSDAQIKDYFHRNSAEQLQQSLNAMICLKRHGIYICKQRLGMAAFHFKKALGFNPVQLTIAEEENSEEMEFSDENDDDEEYDEEFDANIIDSVIDNSTQ
eukprot:gene16313-17957_t